MQKKFFFLKKFNLNCWERGTYECDMYTSIHTIFTPAGSDLQKTIDRNRT